MQLISIMVWFIVRLCGKGVARRQSHQSWFGNMAFGMVFVESTNLITIMDTREDISPSDWIKTRLEYSLDLRIQLRITFPFPVSFGFYTDCHKEALHFGAQLSRGDSGKGDRSDLDILSELALWSVLQNHKWVYFIYFKEVESSTNELGEGKRGM